MKIAIMTNDFDSFEKPLALGLKRMLDKLEVSSKIFWKGYAILERIHVRPKFNVRSLSDQYHNMMKLFATTELAFFDVIVVVSTIPTAFLKECHSFIEVLRHIFPHKPIVMYGTSYLPTLGSSHYKRIREDDVDNFGMERYDYYLCASAMSQLSMPEDNNPVSVVGVNLEDVSLRVDTKREFLALLDFERPAHIKERAVMVQALEETGTKYVVLNGHYRMDAIRLIYRSASAYFVAHSESFGLPICELQACGAYIFAPFSNWAPAHWLKDDLNVAGEGRLSGNFIIYENDLSLLKQQLEAIRISYDPYRVVENFLRHHPQFYYGDLEELKKFIQKVAAGSINGRTHLDHRWINKVLMHRVQSQGTRVSEQEKSDQPLL